MMITMILTIILTIHQMDPAARQCLPGCSAHGSIQQGSNVCACDPGWTGDHCHGEDQQGDHHSDRRDDCLRLDGDQDNIRQMN